MSQEQTDQAPRPAYVGYVLIMILLMMIFNSCDRAIVSVLVEDIRADLQLSDRQMGFLLGPAFAVVNFCAILPLARLADRWSRPRVIALGLVFWSAMTALGGIAQNAWQLTLSRMGVGIGEAAGGPAGQALISEYVSPLRRARAMSLITIGGMIGVAVGMIYGGWASQTYSWRFALISVGLPGIVVGILFWLTIVDRHQLTSHPSESENLGNVLKALRKNQAYVYLVFAASGIGITSFGSTVWDPTYFRRIYGMSAAEAGTWYFFLAMAPVILAGICSGYLVDKFVRRDIRWYAWIPAISCLLLVPVKITFYLLPPEPYTGGIHLGFLLFALSAFLAGFFVPATSCLAQMLAPPGGRSISAAVWGMVSNVIGWGVGPIIVGDLNVRLEPHFGEDAIKYSLIGLTLCSLSAVWLYWMTATKLKSLPEHQAQLAEPALQHQ